jgi:hypothetical protein
MASSTINKQRATRPALLEPLANAAVDLDELAQALPSLSRLVWPRGSSLATEPDALFDEPLADGLAADRDAMELLSFSCASFGPKSA